MASSGGVFMTNLNQRRGGGFPFFCAFLRSFFHFSFQIFFILAKFVFFAGGFLCFCIFFFHWRYLDFCLKKIDYEKNLVLAFIFP